MSIADPGEGIAVVYPWLYFLRLILPVSAIGRNDIMSFWFISFSGSLLCLNLVALEMQILFYIFFFI